MLQTFSFFHVVKIFFSFQTLKIKASLALLLRQIGLLALLLLLPESVLGNFKFEVVVVNVSVIIRSIN